MRNWTSSKFKISVHQKFPLRKQRGSLASPLLSIYPNKIKLNMETLIQKGTCTSRFIAVLFTVAEIIGTLSVHPLNG